MSTNLIVSTLALASPILDAGLYYFNSRISGINQPKTAATYAAACTLANMMVRNSLNTAERILLQKQNENDQTITEIKPLTVATEITKAITSIAGGIYVGRKAALWRTGLSISGREIIKLGTIYTIESIGIGAATLYGNAIVNTYHPRSPYNYEQSMKLEEYEEYYRKLNVMNESNQSAI